MNELTQVPAHLVAQGLKALADQNKVFNAMATAFAMRERTRNIITIQRLAKTMKGHGFEFTNEEYRVVLSKLAALGVGKLHLKKGSIKALIDITVTLQSIGQAALGQKGTLDRARLTRHYTKVMPLPVKHVTQVSKDSSNPLRSVSVNHEGIVFQFNPKSNLEDTISAAVGIYKTMAKRGNA